MKTAPCHSGKTVDVHKISCIEIQPFSLLYFSKYVMGKLHLHFWEFLQMSILKGALTFCTEMVNTYS